MNLNRRDFILSATALGAYSAFRLYGAAPAGEKPILRFGMVTDIHYAGIDPDPKPIGVVGRRFYRESKRKLDEAVAVFNERRLAFAIELGDFKDLTGGKSETLRHLDEIEASFAAFKGPRYHVFGNHDFDCLTPTDLAAHLANDGRPMASGHYAFAHGGVKFIVLDACYDSQLRHYSCNNPWNDANVPPEELDWLARELDAAKGPVVVFCHQRLDSSAEPRHLVRNAASVRRILERGGKVKAVFTGHQHKGAVNTEGGIPYYSLRALVCDSGEGNNSFAEVALYSSGAFTVTGWRNAASVGTKGEFPECGIVAHRGDAAEYPENTAAALKAAVAKGAEMVEIDEWRCKSGELVVMHDGSVERTTDGKGRICDLTLAEIKALDAGAKKGAAFAGARVPTLPEALACFPKTGILLNIHCKTGDAAPEVAGLLRREGRLAQGILMMDSRRDLVALKEKCPWARTGLVMNTDAGWAKPWTEAEAWRKLRDAAELGVEFVQILPKSHCTRAQLDFLHARGIRTTYFVANDAETMRTISAEGHDFIFTDFYSAMRPHWKRV